MAIRSLNEGKEHEQLITALANKFTAEGYSVKADHIGYPNGAPAQIVSHIPDISASKLNQRIVIEAETGDSISTDQTFSQWREFSRIAGCEFHVIVPKKSLQLAQNQAQTWGIRVDHWWYL